MSEKLNDIQNMKKRLDDVSPSFCLAKWLQVTLHLQTGYNHSCHHPVPHKIPLKEIAADPSALHNTNFKKIQRQAMLNGERPAECSYCWNIEDSPGQNASDRHIKSNDTWAEPHLDEVKNWPAKANINPKYLEVSFSNACNFKCAYCMPDISSKWFEEIKQFGAYPTSNNFNSIENLKMFDKIPYGQNEPNPYVDAFWQWWPEVSKDLKVFRITGGEPLLAKSTFKVFEHLMVEPNLNLEFALNSNLGVPFALIEKMASHIENLLGLGTDGIKKVKSFTLFTSVDTHGNQAEYIRTGLKYSEFLENIEYLLARIPTLQIVVMCTTNALSVTKFKVMLSDVLRIKQKYFSPQRGGTALTLDTSYLRLPDFLSIKILTEDFSKYLQDAISFMRDTLAASGDERSSYSHYEIAKVHRIFDYMSVPVGPKWLAVNRNDFFAYINEYDRRRNLSFSNVFPEMVGFLELCGSSAKPVRPRPDASL